MVSLASARTIRWGILGTGRVARDFAEGLRYVSGAELAVIGPRTAEKADHFARISGAQRACKSYEALVTDPTVDVVYVATPHTLHKSHCLLALEAGKAVLCEKPFTMNAGEAQAVIAIARQRKLFCMEAMWMHFLPGMQKAIELIRTGVIGEPRMLTADFGIPIEFNPNSRLFSAALGGDAMMRIDAFEKVNGYRADMIAGEDPEVCVRLRAAGWKVWRLDREMTVHDSAIMRFGQWWRRSIRGGYAFAEGAARHGTAPERHWVRESRRAWFWGLGLPVFAVVCTAWVGPFGLVAFAVYPLQVVRLALRGDRSMRENWWRAVFLVIGKFPEMLGQLQFLARRVLGGKSRLIEYK